MVPFNQATPKTIQYNQQESLANARQPCVYEDLFMLSHLYLTPSSWGTPCDINSIYTSLKNTFRGLQFSCWQYGFIFIRLAVIASETREMLQNSKRIWPHSSSRSSKVIDLGVNGKQCDFPLVINCNFSRICYRFEIFTLKDRKLLILPAPPLFNTTTRGEPFRMSGWNLPCNN